LRIAAAYIQIGQVQAPIWGHPRFPIQSAMLVPRCHAFTSQFPGGAEIVLTMLFLGCPRLDHARREHAG